MVKLELFDRYFFLKLLVVAVLLLFAGRLIAINVFEADEYIAMAHEMRTSSRTLFAKRGEIYMLSGNDEVVPLVMNERTWLIYVDPYFVGQYGDDNKNNLQATLTNILGDKITAKWSDVWSDMSEKTQYVVIARDVEWSIAKKLVDAKTEKGLVGFGMQETSRRVYPQQTLASQVVGFVNAEGNKSGIEDMLNERLTGTDGLRKYIRDASNVPLSIGDENVEIPAVDGENIVLTLDEVIQRKVEKVLKTHVDNNVSTVSSASAVIMNPNDGTVYAMSSYPSFDPSEYWNVKDASVYLNKATASLYEPASICKPFTYAMAINEGALKPTDTYYNAGYTKVGNCSNCTVRNATGTEHTVGQRTYYEALNNSLNTGSIEALRLVGGGDITKSARYTMYDYLHNRFHLGQKTGIELYEEQGRIYSPDESEGSAIRYSNMTFGHGMSLTMIQTASAFSSLINGGKYYQPSVVAGTLRNGELVRSDKKDALNDTVSAETSATMRDMLEQVYNSYSRYQLKPVRSGYNIGAKTGTAETMDDNGKYTSNKTNVGAIGYGGSKKDGALPEFVILIRIDGKTLLWGSAALPLFNELSDFMFEHLRIEPETK